MEVNNNKNGIWGLVTVAIGAAGEAGRRYLRAKGQKELQDKVTKSLPEHIDEDTTVDESNITFSVVKKSELDLSKFTQLKVSEEEVNEWKAFISSSGGEALKGFLSGSSVDGLVKCDVPLKDLFRVKDNPGAMRGYVMKNGKYYKQAQFTKADISNVAPLMVFQCMSAVTSQYYQQIIFEKLCVINNNIDLLLEHQTSQDRARLKVAYSHLLDLSKKKSFDIADKQIVSDFSRIVEEIREKYRSLLSKFNEKNMLFLYVKPAWSDKTEAKSKITALDESHYFDYLSIAMQAEALVYIASAISVKVAHFLGNEEDARIYVGKMNLDYWMNYALQFRQIRHEVLKYLEFEADSSWFQGKSIKKLIEEQERRFNSVEKSMQNLQKQFEYKTTQYIKFEEDGSANKFILLEEH